MNELIQQARELCEKSTPGPWVRVDTQDYAEIHVEGTGPSGTPLSLVANSGNAVFIAASRTLVPQLCDALEAAQKEIAGLQKQIDTITGGYDYYANRSQQFENAAKEWAAENKRLTSRAEKAEAERERADQAALNYQQKCRDIAKLEQELEKAQFDVDINKRLYETACTERDFLEAENRWIPVNERLPELEKTSLYENNRGYFYRSTTILTAGVDESGCRFVGTDMLTKYGDEKEKFACKSCTVTHWRPLPEPPKGE